MDRLISEQAVIDAIAETIKHNESVNDLLGRILAIPSAEPKIVQKPLKCREAHCGAMCSPIIAESYCENPKECVFYERINDVAIPSADKTCEGCVFTRGCCSCQQCSRFYTDMYTKRVSGHG